MEMKSEEAEETMQQQQVQVPPVLEEKKKKRVMVALDEREGSFYALKWALNNLFTTCDHGLGVDQPDVGVIIIVHVQQPFQHYIYPGLGGPGVYENPSVMESVKKAQEHNSAILLSRAVQICEEKPIKVETVVLDGDPKEMICQVAEQTHPDILVVGSRGLSKLKRTFLGSVSDYCAHHAKCPILIVKPPK
ncbi:hypothetical protein IFM89_007887 [Coptis chinensis]|uniref:UspA domain-containing protein n=1 Tax=Coptis chinensis TaxID=261450 RepID=A0A835HBV4_9MAGN|nr:hypothetical protein IFM89_007887 [Coptis chinensis]